jgi:MtrB/PioB family decaheme-associated outer membrane protein
MTLHSPLFLLGALGLLSVAATAAAAEVDTSAWKCSACPYPKGTSGTVEAGVGVVSDASAKFGDFTGLQRKGAHLILGGDVNVVGEGGYFASLTASDLGLGSRALAAQSGREGVYTVRLGYAEIPHHLSDTASTPFLGNGGGTLTLPAGYPASSTATMPLASTLQGVELGFKRSRLDAGITGVAVEGWTYQVSLRHDVRDGTQRGAGSFFSSAAQLAVPVDQVTDQLEVSTSYTSRPLQATLGYQASLFHNRQDSLTWANPFTPVVAGADRGQLALAPDNQLHQIFGSAGYEVSPTIRASADFSLGRMTQDAAYLDATANRLLAPTVPALPAPSLHGRVDTFNGSVKITATPIDKLRLNASYMRDVRDNRTASAAYPAVSTDMFLGPGTRTNQPYSFWQDRFKLNADYRGPGSLKTSIGIDQDNRERSYQEVVTTRETTLWGRLGAQPLENLLLSLKLAHGDRNGSSYGVATWVDPPQNPLMRKFYLADRVRDSAGLRADFTASEKVSIGVTADFAQDDYNKSSVGLTDARSTSLGADLSVAVSEGTHLRAFVQTEAVRSQQAGSQAVSAADWSARSKDRVEVLGLGVTHAAIANKLDIGADLTYSRSRSDITVDPGAGVPPFPTAITRLKGAKVYATYKLKEQLWLTGSFWYERYDTSDWHVDGVSPDAVANLLAFGEQAPRYSVTVLRIGLRQRF